MGANTELLTAVLRKDLYTFIQATFPIVSPGARFLPNWHVEAMATNLTEVLAGDITRLIITVPPLDT